MANETATIIIQALTSKAVGCGDGSKKDIQKNIHRACRWIINFEFDHFYRCLHFSIGFEKYISKSHQVAYRLQVQEAIHQLHVDALQVAIVLRNLRVAE